MSTPKYGGITGPIGRLENAKTLGETSLMFLVHPGLDYSEIRFDFPKF